MTAPDLAACIEQARSVFRRAHIKLPEVTVNADSNGSPGKRIGGTFSSGGADIPGRLLRDDRSALARHHYLSWEWYRSDNTRTSVSYSIRDCGMLPSWKDLSGTNIPYPTLGKILGTLKAGGQDLAPITPYTSIEYDNDSGVTTWHTDWTELDSGTH